MNGEYYLEHKYLWLVGHNVPLFKFITKFHLQSRLVYDTTVKQENPALFFLFNSLEVYIF